MASSAGARVINMLAHRVLAGSGFIASEYLIEGFAGGMVVRGKLAAEIGNAGTPVDVLSTGTELIPCRSTMYCATPISIRHEASPRCC